MKILIVDDEPPARDRLRQLIDDAGEHEVIGEAGNGREALDLARQKKPDVILLDIRMPGMDGIETAHHLNQGDAPPAVVFTTAYDEYAIEAFETNAIGYVLKPVRRERLAQALARAARITNETLDDIGQQSGLNTGRNHLCARLHDELKLIPVSNVQYFVADQKYVSVVHADGRDLIEESLKSLESEFAERFVRIHRAAVVAVDSIDALKRDDDGRMQVILRVDTGDDELIVSRRHAANVKRRLKEG
ncbi:MAG: LytTR family DNA-binding domain-containing protein [Woeseiaceae bacterium]|nr:LytTR family DNA-binding domain-containing protein [Woeseiaceae bacterium]